MANDIKVGKVIVDLDTLIGVSRSNVNKMFSHKGEVWRDALWSHLEMLNPSQEKEPTNKKSKPKKQED